MIYRDEAIKSYYRSYVDNYEYCSTTSTTTSSSTSVSTVTTSSSSSSTTTSTTPTTYLTESSSTTSTSSSKTERNTCSNDIDIDFGAITPNGDTTKATIEECYPYILMHINESKSYSVYNPEFQPCTDSMYFDCSNPGIAYNQYLVCQNSLRPGFYDEGEYTYNPACVTPNRHRDRKSDEPQVYVAAVIDENNDLYVYLGQDMIIDASNTDMVFTQVFFHTSCKIKSITTTIDGFKAENQFGQDTKYIEITPQKFKRASANKKWTKDSAHVVFDVNEDFNQNRCQVLPKVKYNDQTDPSRVQVTTDSSTFTYNIQNYTVAVMETNGHVSAYGYDEIDRFS